eukprot:GHVN01001452.1.p1 GENE.GHVN01001452.1~~GHVN01001452.1.p1  ORF type:complete len:1897 (-),score=219.26 GHVN01001452.1:9339-14339(-)
MVGIMCDELEMWAPAALIRALIPQLKFGVQRDLMALMEIEGISSTVARALFSSGLRTPTAVVGTTPAQLQRVILRTVMSTWPARQQRVDNLSNASAGPGFAEIHRLGAVDVALQLARTLIVRSANLVKTTSKRSRRQKARHGFASTKSEIFDLGSTNHSVGVDLKPVVKLSEPVRSLAPGMSPPLGGTPELDDGFVWFGGGGTQVNDARPEMDKRKAALDNWNMFGKYRYYPQPQNIRAQANDILRWGSAKPHHKGHETSCQESASALLSSNIPVVQIEPVAQSALKHSTALDEQTSQRSLSEQLNLPPQRSPPGPMLHIGLEPIAEEDSNVVDSGSTNCHIAENMTPHFAPSGHPIVHQDGDVYMVNQQSNKRLRPSSKSNNDEFLPHLETPMLHGNGEVFPSLGLTSPAFSTPQSVALCSHPSIASGSSGPCTPVSPATGGSVSQARSSFLAKLGESHLTQDDVEAVHITRSQLRGRSRPTRGDLGARQEEPHIMSAGQQHTMTDTITQLTDRSSQPLSLQRQQSLPSAARSSLDEQRPPQPALSQLWKSWIELHDQPDAQSRENSDCAATVAERTIADDGSMNISQLQERQLQAAPMNPADSSDVSNLNGTRQHATETSVVSGTLSSSHAFRPQSARLPDLQYLGGAQCSTYEPLSSLTSRSSSASSQHHSRRKWLNLDYLADGGIVVEINEDLLRPLIVARCHFYEWIDSVVGANHLFPLPHLIGNHRPSIDRVPNLSHALQQTDVIGLFYSSNGGNGARPYCGFGFGRRNSIESDPVKDLGLNEKGNLIPRHIVVSKLSIIIPHYGHFGVLSCPPTCSCFVDTTPPSVESRGEAVSSALFCDSCRRSNRCPPLPSCLVRYLGRNRAVVVVENAKEVTRQLLGWGVDFNCSIVDAFLGQWLLEPSDTLLTLNEVETIHGIQITQFTDMAEPHAFTDHQLKTSRASPIGVDRGTLQQTPTQQFTAETVTTQLREGCVYLGGGAATPDTKWDSMGLTTWRLLLSFAVLNEKMRIGQLDDLFWGVEAPVAGVLGWMEHWGVGIKHSDSDMGTFRSDMIKKKMVILQREASKALGRRVLLSSPEDCGAALFHDLKLPLPAGTKVKTARNGKVTFPSNQEVLKQLKGSHPLVSYITEFRQLHRAVITYSGIVKHSVPCSSSIDTLCCGDLQQREQEWYENGRFYGNKTRRCCLMCSETLNGPNVLKSQKTPRHQVQSRVHSEFCQIATLTGRLTSRNPNLLCVEKEFAVQLPRLTTLQEEMTRLLTFIESGAAKTVNCLSSHARDLMIFVSHFSKEGLDPTLADSGNVLARLLLSARHLLADLRTTGPYPADTAVVVQCMSTTPGIGDVVSIKPAVSTIEDGGACVVEVNIHTDQEGEREHKCLPATDVVRRSCPVVAGIEKGSDSKFNPRDLVVAGPGCTLLSIDYDQLELRLMAHISGDKQLVDAFQQDTDVFAAIAASWSGKNAQDVTPEERAGAKRLSYGMLYGMGVQALAVEMNLPIADAADILESFKQFFVGVQRFVAKFLKMCQADGYVESMFGRRRYLEQMGDGQLHEQQKAERQAVNTLCQASAADLVKLAMHRCHTRLKRMRCHNMPKEKSPLCAFPARILLQVHDELLFEVEEAHYPLIRDAMTEEMTSVIGLAIPLRVSCKCGPSWGSLQKEVHC